MATSIYTDFQIREAEFNAGFMEMVNQNTNAFNAASNNALRLSAADLMGHYAKTRFWDRTSSLITRQDLTTTAAGTATKATTSEHISVKLHRRYQHEAALPALKLAGFDASDFSFMLGQEVGEEAVLGYLNAAVKSVAGALSGQTAAPDLVEDYSATGDLDFTALRQGMALMGDSFGKIAAFVMHSKAFFDLVGDGISNYKIETIAGQLIARGVESPITFGKPVVITDDASLVISGAPDNYVTLALVEGAVDVTAESTPTTVSEVVTGLEQLVFRTQGEYTFNVGLRGYQWDTTNGGINPADATIATATNWDAVVSNANGFPGVYIQTT